MSHPFRTRRSTIFRKLPHTVAAWILLLPLLVHAEPWDDQSQKAVDMLHGPMAKKIAIVALAAAGIACLRGKLPLMWMICIVVGVLFIAKGDAIVNYLWS